MKSGAPSGRVLASVWLCAFAIAIGAMAGLLRMAPDPDPVPPEWLKAPPFGIFIGTSLVRDAFPPGLSAEEIFFTAKPGDRIIRASLNNLSDTKTVERFRYAVNAGIKQIFVEIDPMLRTFRSDHAWVRIVVDFSDRLRSAARGLLGIRSAATDSNMSGDGAREGVYDGNIGALLSSYPVIIHAPYDPAAIADILAIARTKGLNVVWVAMPRSRTAADYLGPAFENDFQARLQAFATEFDAKIWRPALSWPNEFFLDQAHMNGAGRARFLHELKLFAATAP